MPVERVAAPEHDRARSLGWLGMRWIEHFCIHGPGDVAGTSLNPRLERSIPLSDEQGGLLLDAYALDPGGRRLYDSAFYSRPKGASKSALASWISIFEALGPCRFAGFAEGGEVFRWRDFEHRYSAGEPMGRVILYPFVRLLATEEQQVSSNTYTSVLFNFQEGPLREIFPTPDAAGITRTFLPEGGEIRPSTAGSASKEGGKETHANFDETHLYILPELHRMYATVRRNLGKRKDSEPWSLETSTMYEPGAGSVAELSHDQADLIRRGRVRRARMLFDHREAPPLTNEELAEESLVIPALREAYGDAASYMDFERIYAEIVDTRNDPNNSRRYWLNQRTPASDAWLDPAEWDRLHEERMLPKRKALISLGLDGSKTEDATALIATDIDSGFQWPLGIWELGPGQEIDRGAVDFAVRNAFDIYDVVAFLSDVEHWESYIDQWNADFRRTLCVHAGPKNSIAWDMRGSRLRTVKMIEAFHAAVVDRLVKHSGDPTHAQHVYNARRRPNQYGVDIAKEAPHSPRKIDAAVASCLSWQARSEYRALDRRHQRRRGSGKVMVVG